MTGKLTLLKEHDTRQCPILYLAYTRRVNRHSKMCFFKFSLNVSLRHHGSFRDANHNGTILMQTSEF